jgi:hypothetical protein
MEGEKAAALYSCLPLKLRESRLFLAQCLQYPYPCRMTQSVEDLGPGSIESVILILVSRRATLIRRW